MSDTVAQDTEGAAPPSRASTPLVGKFGRYAIEGLLARGGMGVVYLAFDPELERRVALKVLSSDDDESRARLLREARAMARLAHGNVVTVFDVGTIDGRDFVAMELMEAGTLHDWLHAKPRRTNEILRAFQSAGRGLAAAHAAGLVHRDFKPANVLRGRDGRFKVTDFGLARENTDSLPPRQKLRSDVLVIPRAPSVLDDVTKTGSVLGTPSYMAPEQWDNAVVTPASDQFSFCVAMWEAFAGRRPFEATEIEVLRDAVARGPRELDAGAIPRQLRGILARGLDPDPNKRWPTMERLLAAIDRVQRTRRRILASAGGISFTAAVAVVVALSTRPSAPACGGIEPRLSPDAVWSSARAAAIAKGDRAFANLRVTVDDDVSAWRALRADACREPAKHVEELACLDGVMARLDAVAEIAEQVRVPRGANQVGDWLVDPSVCAQQAPPRLMAVWGKDARAGLHDLVNVSALHLLGPDAAHAPPAPVASGTDPCGASVITLAWALREPDYGKADPLYDSALDTATACDERLRADILMVESYTTSPDARRDSLIAKVRAAAVRVPQSDIEAQLLLLEAQGLFEERRLDDANRKLERALELAHLRHRDALALDVQLNALDVRLHRNTAADITAVKTALPALQRDALTDEQAAQIAIDAAHLAWNAGDVAGAHAQLRAAAHRGLGRPDIGDPTDGLVVDRAGKPVAGATVLVSTTIDLDAEGPLPFTDWPSETTTDARGAFTIPFGPGTVAVALHGEERSLARHVVDGPLRLELQPTRRITGRVEGWIGERNPVVIAYTAGSQDVVDGAPLAPDGSFVLARVPDVPVRIQVVFGFDEQGSNVTPVAQRGPIDGLVVHLVPNDHKLRIDLKSATSAPPLNAFVWVLPDSPDVPATTGQVWPRDAYARHYGLMSPAGLYVDLVQLPHTAMLVCAVGQFSSADSADFQDLWFSGSDNRIACEHVAADATKVVLRLSPTEVKDR